MADFIFARQRARASHHQIRSFRNTKQKKLPNNDTNIFLKKQTNSTTRSS